MGAQALPLTRCGKRLKYERIFVSSTPKGPGIGAFLLWPPPPPISILSKMCSLFLRALGEAIVGLGNQVMGSRSKKRKNLTKRRPTGSAFDKKETLFFPSATFLFVKFFLFLLREPATGDSVSTGYNQQTDTTNLVHIR